jgi:hypothetical protein
LAHEQIHLALHENRDFLLDLGANDVIDYQHVRNSAGVMPVA